MPTNPARAEPTSAVRTGRLPISLVAAFLLVAVLAAACGGNDKGDKDGKGTSTTLSPTEKRLQDGIAAQGAGDLDKAKEAFLAVIAQQPSNKVAHYDLGLVYQQLNDVKGSAEEYRKALVIDPNYRPALFNIAVLLAPTDANAAAGYYRQIIAINADDANAHFNLGLLLRRTGKDAEGNAEVGKALELNPSLASRLPTTPGATTTTKK